MVVYEIQNPMEKLKEIIALLDSLGHEIESERNPVCIKSQDCIDKYVPESSGVYWIETTMPVDLMKTAISKVSKKDKRVRQTKPKGEGFIQQRGKASYIVYSGTEENLNKRLKQHLFNLDSDGTAKLSCIIDQPPFSSYKWKVSFVEIDSYEIRYAIEAWWRVKIGWPLFCIK